MKAAYDLESRVWLARGNGHLRPILVESGTREDAVKAYGEEFQNQIVEEERFAREYEEGEIATHFSEKAFNEIFATGKDYEQ